MSKNAHAQSEAASAMRSDASRPWPRPLDGRVAIVTGSSDGIGRATALQLARKGAHVILNARGTTRLEAARSEIAALDPSVGAVRGDVNNGATARRLVSTALQRFGRIDILVNNAGGSTHGKPFGATTREDWEQTLCSNLTSTFQMCLAVVPVMQRQRGGRIVNVSSLAGRQRSVLSAADYASAKAGMIGLTRQLAGELGPFGITVNAVAPGVTATPRVRTRWQNRSAKDRRKYLQSIPLRRLGEPDEVARAIIFLASEDASYITGVTLDVNGGAFMG